MIAADSASVSSIIRKQARLQRKNAIIIRLTIIFLMLICLLVLPLWAAYLFFGGIGPGMFSQVPVYIYVVIVLLVYGIFFVVPFLLCLPVVIPFAFKQKNISRIIIFRKFNDDLSKKSLRHIIRTDLSNYGHIFTLSDKNFKIKWYIKIPLFLGQMSFFHFRQKTISTKEDIVNLEKRLSTKLWLNVNWLLSFSKIFSVKTTDELWKETANTLLKETSLILFDISYNTDALEWEFSEIKNLGYTRNIIAITNSEKLLEESKWKNIFDSQKDLKIPVFYYDRKGKMPDKIDFDFTVSQMLTTSFKEEDRRIIRKNFLNRTITIIGISITIFLCSFFLLSPYLIPDIVGKISPFGNQVITAYLQSKVHSIGVVNNDRVNQLIIYQRIKKNWQQKAETAFLNYTTNHKASECEAIQSIMVEFPDFSQLKKYIDLTLTGEFPIADSAASIILNINPPTLTQIALQCIASARIDVKERGLRLIKKVPLDSNFVVALINILKKAVPAKATPITHLGVRHNFSFIDSSLSSLESNFYINLADIFKCNQYISNQSLQTLLNSSFYQIRIFASLILAEDNNASILTQLIKATFLKTENYYVLSNDYDTVQPYEERIDDMLCAFKNPISLPNIDIIIGVLNSYYFNVEDSSTLISLLSFTIRNYSLSDFSRLIQNLGDNKINELRDALCYCITNDTSEIYEKVQNMILLSRSLLIKNIHVQDIDSKLQIAKLLAYSGDISILSILKEAANDNIVLNKTTILYLHDKKIKSILKILYKNIKISDKVRLYKSRDAQLLNQFFL